MEGFTIENYGKKSTFSSFLPGISGIYGTPIWCYYVNRGQCIASFGVEDKDHAIMEFSPAHQSYQSVKRTGFRTFVKKDGVYFEPFKDEEVSHRMNIEMNGLEIGETNEAMGIETKVNYFNLPGEAVGALVRKLTIKNIGTDAASVEVLDGMPALIPYGVNMDNLKNMGQTVKAWMQVEDVDTLVPYFRVRASIEDSTAVKEVVGGNFSFACLADGSRLVPVVDPDLVFGYDVSLEKAIGFMESGLKGMLAGEQVMQNQFPCSFYGAESVLKEGEELTIYQITGQVENKEILRTFVEGQKFTESKNVTKNKLDGRYFEDKREEAGRLTEELCQVIDTHTASAEFDAYCKQTYLDNVLRGGYPIRIGKDKVFYVYSRKHGDLERDYNYFRMLPEFYSQGNGNFRDVNQNRRCDVAFTPYVGDLNIKNFYNLIQLDGYNPLGVEKVSYMLNREDAKAVTDIPAAQEFLTAPFTPGAFFKALRGWGMDSAESGMELFEKVMERAENRINGDFIEGYWTDHWTYNLDLIEGYLQIFPEREEELLFEAGYSYFVSQVNINKRQRRYEKTPNGIRQYHPLDEEHKRTSGEKILMSNYGKGEVIYSTLMEKLILLCAVKFAALDAYGMGIEMEGGKPGWYDALNGLSGLLGSSMCETYELGRNLEFTVAGLKKYPKEVALLSEMVKLIEDLGVIAAEEMTVLQKEQEVISFWNRINDVKEDYREKTYQGISGERISMSADDLVGILESWLEIVRMGIRKACLISGELCPAYFYYDVTQYEETADGIIPLRFQVKTVPFFLEGPVRFLKLDHSLEEKRELCRKVKNSDLYDKKLSMYKVNASLGEATYEIGRAKAFTPGWLENESIWLHMEYKYLLELLKSGMYEEFAEDFHKALVPFLDQETYGRSILENSSFIASSKNPNKKYHGKGFVARLSGSTVEFIHMWQIMMFGKNPFMLEDGQLTLRLEPMIPDYLAAETVTGTFLGTVRVDYQLGEKKSYLPGNYRVEKMELHYRDGSSHVTDAGFVRGARAKDIREGKVSCIKAKLI